MNIINRCVTIRKSISFITNNASNSSKFIIGGKRYFTSLEKENNNNNDNKESEQLESESENIENFDEIDHEDLELQLKAGNIVFEKNIKEVSKKISEFYTPSAEKIKLQSIDSKNVTPLMKCIHLNNQAIDLISKSKFEEAETILIGGISLYERSEESELMTLDTTEMGITTHQTYGYLLSNLAYVYHTKGLFVDAIKYYTKSLGFLETQEDQPFYGNTLLNLSELFSLLQDNLKAIETCKLSIKVLEDIKDYIIDDRFGLALLNLSSYLSIDGRYEEALPHCERSFAMLEKSLGRNNELVQSCATNLSKLYQQLNKKEEQEKLDALFLNPAESSLKFNFDLKKDLPHVDLSKLKQKWSEQGHQRVFDIEGFYKSSITSKQEFTSFLTQLEAQGIKYGPETSQILKPELESTSYAPDVVQKWKPLTISLSEGQIQKN